jgi:hypothetical protein
MLSHVEMTLLLTKKMAELYDEMFDHFHQDEVRFTHATLRVLTQYQESRLDDTKTKITNQVSDFFSDESEERSLFRRCVILDRPTHDWMRLLSERVGEDSLESTFFTGVVVLSVIKRLAAQRPDASLDTFPTRTFLRKILFQSPQSLN